MATHALIIVKEITTGLQTAESREEIIKWLTIIRCLFVRKIINESQSSSLYGYNCSTLLSIRGVVISQYAIRIYEQLISRFSGEWFAEVTTYVFNTLLLSIFLEGPYKHSLIALLNKVSETEKKNFSFYKFVLILEKFISRNILKNLLIEESSSCVNRPYQVLDVDAEILLGNLSSFTEKIANKLQHENSEIFLPNNYIPTLALAILDTLQWAHDMLVANQDVSLLFVSSLVGKLCLTGYADLLLDTLLPHLSVSVRDDYIWCRICERVFACVPDRNLESKQLLQNIIGYLTMSHSRQQLLAEVTVRLLNVWSDRSAMKHISFEQHLYITRALVVYIGALNEQEKTTLKGELLQNLMHGVQAHLESSDPAVRTLGMTLAKTLASAVDPTGPQLEYDLDLTDPTVKDLLSYRELPEDPGPSPGEKAVKEELSKSADAKCETETDSIASGGRHPRIGSENVKMDLDSDDDLEPYDMSNDKKVTNSSPPKYVRECMEGFISSSDDPDRTELCLQYADNLIRQKTSDLDEIAVESAKILLHLENTHNFQDFLLNRFSALVALTVKCQHKVAEYLSGQFYERNYSSRQCMDILEILANAAQELSQPDKQTPESDKP